MIKSSIVCRQSQSDERVMSHERMLENNISSKSQLTIMNEYHEGVIQLVASNGGCSFTGIFSEFLHVLLYPNTSEWVTKQFGVPFRFSSGLPISLAGPILLRCSICCGKPRRTTFITALTPSWLPLPPYLQLSVFKFRMSLLLLLTCQIRRDKPETQEYMWHFNALNSTSPPRFRASTLSALHGLRQEAREGNFFSKCSVGKLKFETKLSHSSQGLVFMPVHASGARRQILFMGASPLQ